MKRKSRFMKQCLAMILTAAMITGQSGLPVYAEEMPQQVIEQSAGSEDETVSVETIGAGDATGPKEGTGREEQTVSGEDIGAADPNGSGDQEEPEEAEEAVKETVSEGSAEAEEAAGTLSGSGTKDDPWLVDNWTELATKLFDLRRAQSTTYYFTLNADIKPSDSESRKLELNSNIKICLDLNGHITDGNNKFGAVIEVSGSTLNLSDSDPDAVHDPAITYTDPYTNRTVTVTGGIITGGKGKVTINSGTCGGGVYVSGSEASPSTFNMSGGTIIKNTAGADGKGGGVYMSRGPFNMTGGMICGNSAKDGGGVYMNCVAGDTISSFSLSGNGVICGNRASYAGGGVYNRTTLLKVSGGSINSNIAENQGGGVYTNGTTFDMSGGEICKNTAKHQGGGVYNTSSFTMTDGTIRDNKASGQGGGVYDTNIFTLKGGTIRDNEAVSYGGGVYSSGTIKINGGSISGNTSGSTGGGVYISNNMNMSGGSISGNTSAGQGGGVYIYGSSEISGSPKVTGNVKGGSLINNLYLESGKITVNGALNEAASIGVTMGTPGVFTSGLSGKGTAERFASDIDVYGVGLTAQNEAALKQYVYIASGLTAENKEYDGSTTASVKGTAVLKRIGDDTVVSDLKAANIFTEFSDRNVGENKTVSIRSALLNKSDAYILDIDRSNEELGLKADISAKGVTISGLTASDKVYNGTTTATVSGPASIVGEVLGDDLNVSAGTAAFTDPNAGTGKTVKFSGWSLTGSDAGNYTLSAQPADVTANITKAKVSNPDAVNRTYYHSRDNADSITLVGLPADCGTVTWKNPTKSGGLTYTVEPSVSDAGVLSYTVGSGAAGSTGAIRVVAETQNYEDLTFNVNITLTNKIQVKPKDGSSVSLKNSTLTYGQKLSALSFNTAEFVSDDEHEYTIEGSLAWKEPDTKPDPKTTAAVWGFTPNDSSYDSCEGIAAITVNKAPVEGAYVTLGPVLTFNGSEQIQTVSKVQLGDDDITSLCDVTDNKGTNAGKYTLKVTAKADSNYTGSVTKDFSIAKKAITPTVTLTGGDSYPYTGGEITPEYQVKDGETTLASTDCSAVFSDNKDVGTARLTVSAKDGGNYSFEDTVKEFTITKASHSDVSVSGSAKFGLSGSMDLSDYIENGGSLQYIGVTDEFGVLSGTPAINGTVLSYAFADDGTKVGKAAIVEISVKKCKNYDDYRIIATLNVINCDHTHTELRNEVKPTCSQEGYTGDEVCTECGYIVKRGSSIPKDPDGHGWDEGVVTKKPNILMKGEKLYTCVWCGHKRYEELPFEEPEDGRDMSDIREDLGTLSGDAAPKVEEKTNEDGSRKETVTIGGEKVSEIITAPDGKETVESKIWIGGLKDSYRYTGSAIKPSFHVYDGTRKLKENTDYTVKWSKNKEVGTAEITVKFKGNYKDTKSETLSFKIDPAVLGEDITAYETAVVEKKSAQKPMPLLTWKETGKTVAAKNFNVTYDPSEVKAAGTYTATITSKNKNFDGTAVALIKVAAKDKVLSNVKVKFDPKSYNYNGTAIEPKYSLTMGTTTLTEGKDYKRVSLTGNTNPGIATIIFEAISGNAAGYVGSKTATFKITGKKELNEGTSFTFTCPESVPCAKSGAKPSVTVTDNDNHTTLKEGQDYTLSYSKNKAVTNGEKTAEVKVKGKGNYKSSVTLKYAIAQQSLKAISGNIIVSDQFTTRSKLKAPKITITDVDGKKLKANTDYTVGTPDTSDPANTDTKGIVKVGVTGKGAYKDEIVTVTYRYEDKAAEISKAKVVKNIADQDYTGNEVKLSNAELTGILTAKDKNGATVNLLPGTHFTVKGYTNNVKKGTAKVTIQGIGAYAGTKTLNFKIVQKKVDYKGALVGDGWQ